MRSLVLLACLALTACAGAGAAFKDDATEVPAAAPATPSVAAAPLRSTPAAGGASASSGTRTAASRVAAPAEPPEPTEPSSADPLTQARVDCWMRVEKQRKIRDIDGRIAYVDKCVDALMKGKPAP